MKGFRAALIALAAGCGILEAFVSGCGTHWGNVAPHISALLVNGQASSPNTAVSVHSGSGQVVLTCKASDADNDPIRYDWFASAGTISPGGVVSPQPASGSSSTANTDNIATWTPPAVMISGYQDTKGNALTSAVPGTQFIIVGSNLGTGGTVQFFGGISAATTSWTPNAITVIVPTAPTYGVAGPITITTGGQTIMGPPFTIIAPAGVTGYQLAMAVGTMMAGTPVIGAPYDTSINIVGSNLGMGGTVQFSTTIGASSVTTPVTTTNWMPAQITITVPMLPSYPGKGQFIVTPTGEPASTGPDFTITDNTTPPMPAPATPPTTSTPSPTPTPPTLATMGSTYTITCTVRDSRGAVTSRSALVTVLP